MIRDHSAYSVINHNSFGVSLEDVVYIKSEGQKIVMLDPHIVWGGVSGIKYLSGLNLCNLKSRNRKIDPVYNWYIEAGVKKANSCDFFCLFRFYICKFDFLSEDFVVYIKGQFRDFLGLNPKIVLALDLIEIKDLAADFVNSRVSYLKEQGFYLCLDNFGRHLELSRLYVGSAFDFISWNPFSLRRLVRSNKGLTTAIALSDAVNQSGAKSQLPCYSDDDYFNADFLEMPIISNEIKFHPFTF